MIGEIYSYTLIEREYAPAGFEWCAPYVVALVDIKDGPRLTAQMTDLERDPSTGAWILPEIGEEVEMSTKKMREDGDERGLIIYGYKFRKLIPKLSDKELSEARDAMWEFWVPSLIRKTLSE